MDGKKNLAPATARRVASALGLVGDAAEYFRLLVALNQASDPSECRNAQVGLGRLRRYQEIRRELLDEFDAGKSGVQVVQVNFQLFPLSKRFDEESKET